MKQTGQKKTFWQKLGFGSTGKSAFSQSFTPSSYRTGDFWFFSSDGTETHFSYADLNSCLKAYTDCPPVTAIINRQAQAFVNGKTYILNTRGKEAVTEEAKKLRKLLVTSPNPLQNGKQFDAQGYIYRRLFGYNVVLVHKPVGFPNIEASNLWNIPPYMLQIKEKRGVNFFEAKDLKDCIESVHFSYNGVQVPLDIASLYFIKDFTVGVDTVILPGSRIQALKMPINNIIGAYESENVVINRRGPLSIISSDKSDESGNIALTPGEKEQIEKDFATRYGTKASQVQHMITNAAIKVQTVGFSIKDLMIHEGIKENAKTICDVLNYPPFMMGLIDSTYNNQNTAEKGLYQNCIMPDAESIYEQWEQFFDTQAFNLKLQKDYSHITVLQEDKKLEAESRKIRNEALKIEWENDLITLNEWREANNCDPLPDNRGTMYRSEYNKVHGVQPVATQQQDSTEQPINNAEEIQTP